MTGVEGAKGFVRLAIPARVPKPDSGALLALEWGRESFASDKYAKERGCTP